MKTILIVGNSDGIGLAVTRALVARGERVVGISRSPSPLGASDLRHEVRDVTAPDFGALVEQLSREHGGFDACIYCAGVGSALALPDVSSESRVFEVNLTGMVRTMQALVPQWLAKRQGHFIGLSSIADDIYNSDAPSYSASKAGFSNYLISVGLKLRPLGIAVTNVRFGFVEFTVTHDEPLPNASAELPAPTVPSFATLMFVLPVALTKRTVAVVPSEVTVSLSSHAAKNAKDISAQNVSVRFRMKHLRRRRPRPQRRL